ncbi:MAG: MBL fold metallo-hydrolase [Candidatus Kerfeldbacteria bacterium]|nr:MBL fold metallo-hydrolase [Candidatus Kerfeldbacteria bacterium]
MKLTFYGAAKEVTGSKHLVDLAGSRILLDCGLFQGRRQETQERNQHVGFDPRTIDAVVVSHAHLDHVGWLPLLVKGGYSGAIYGTSATRDLAELILLDAAHIQVQDADYMNRHQYAEAPLHEPLYRPEDIPAVIKLWQPLTHAFLDPAWHRLTPTVECRLYDAGHILGSAAIVLRGREAGQEKVLVFTGDLGRHGAPLLRDPDPIDVPAQTLIMEATYGDRRHHPVESVKAQLVAVVRHAFAQGGKVVVPAFSLGRTQELVYLLHQLTDHGDIPRLPIFVDSPLSERITSVFEAHQRDYDKQTGLDFSRLGEDPLVFRNLTYVHSVEESKALNTLQGPAMILSASGMVTAGRIIHHLVNTIGSPKNTVLFTGYQAAHTLGRKLLSGAKTLDAYGQHIPVRAAATQLAGRDSRSHSNVPGLRKKRPAGRPFLLFADAVPICRGSSPWRP